MNEIMLYSYTLETDNSWEGNINKNSCLYVELKNIYRKSPSHSYCPFMAEKINKDIIGISLIEKSKVGVILDKEDDVLAMDFIEQGLKKKEKEIQDEIKKRQEQIKNIKKKLPVLKKRNTRFNYLYRDGGNWKEHNYCTFPGIITEQQIRKIRNCLEENLYFVPRKIGLPEQRLDAITDMDHIWFEFEGFEQTEEKADMTITLETLTERFEKECNDWEQIEFPTETFYPPTTEYTD